MVKYTSQFFYRSLLAVLGTLLSLNLLLLVVTFNVLFFIPISVQATVLYAVLQKVSWVRTAIRIWSVFLIVSGASALLATVIRLTEYVAYGSTSAFSEINALDVTVKLALLGMGLAFFILSKRFIDIDHSPDDSPDDDRRKERKHAPTDVEDA